MANNPLIKAGYLSWGYQKHGGPGFSWPLEIAAVEAEGPRHGGWIFYPTGPYPLVNIAGWHIPMQKIGSIHLQPGAPIFQPAILDYRSVTPPFRSPGKITVFV